jgi:hypothetical protein
MLAESFMSIVLKEGELVENPTVAERIGDAERLDPVSFMAKILTMQHGTTIEVNDELWAAQDHDASVPMRSRPLSNQDKICLTPPSSKMMHLYTVLY